MDQIVRVVEAGTDWATAEQWRSRGRLVRPGERASYGVTWVGGVPLGSQAFHRDQTDPEVVSGAAGTARKVAGFLTGLASRSAVAA